MTTATIEDVQAPTFNEINAVEFLNQELEKLNVVRYRVYEQELGDDLAVANLYMTESYQTLSGDVNLTLKKDGKFAVSCYSGNFGNWETANQFAQLLQKASGIACKWEAIHSIDDSLDSDESEDTQATELSKQICGVMRKQKWSRCSKSHIIGKLCHKYDSKIIEHEINDMWKRGVLEQDYGQVYTLKEQETQS